MNRQEAIKILKHSCDYIGLLPSEFWDSDAGIIEAIDMAIEALSESRWIPVSERLPDEETDVLVTRTFLGCKDGSFGWNNHIPPSTYVEVAQYFDGEWTALSDEYKVARSRHTDPVAWKPLPAPYREDGEKQCV